MEANEDPALSTSKSEVQEREEPYTTLNATQKRLVIIMTALGACFSPLAGNIYYPALNTLAQDLNVSNTLINLTLTSYMVCCASLTDTLLPKSLA
jgi:hypothetical protein